jgi:hypothetical protein
VSIAADGNNSSPNSATKHSKPLFSKFPLSFVQNTHHNSSNHQSKRNALQRFFAGGKESKSNASQAISNPAAQNSKPSQSLTSPEQPSSNSQNIDTILLKYASKVPSPSNAEQSSAAPSPLKEAVLIGKHLK